MQEAILAISLSLLMAVLIVPLGVLAVYTLVRRSTPLRVVAITVRVPVVPTPGRREAFASAANSLRAPPDTLRACAASIRDRDPWVDRGA